MNNSTNWSNLPSTILNLIFCYTIRRQLSESADYYHNFNQLQALQLTCKHWSKAAQVIIYYSVVLSNMRQVRAFESTLTQKGSRIAYYVRHIVSESKNAQLTIPFPHLIRFASICNRVKTFCAGNSGTINQWRNIKQGEGWDLIFDSLNILFNLNNHAERMDVNFYNRSALQNRTNFKSLNIYELPFIPVTTPLDPNLFEVASHVRIILDRNSSLLYRIGQKLDTCPGIHTMSVSDYNDHLEQDSTLIIAEPTEPITPCLHIRKLLIELNEDSDWWMYRSLIALFPNLNVFSLTIKKKPTNNSRRRLSTENAIQFLEYLKKMPVYYVESLYVENLDVVLRHWLSIEPETKSLDLTYIWREEEKDSCLSLWTMGESAKVCIQSASEKPRILPELDTINASGEINLKSLTLNMSLDPLILEQELDVVDNPLCDFSQIFFECPKLNRLYVSYTGLTIVKPELILGPLVRLFEEVKIERSFIDASFLSRLSDSVDYIGNLTIDRCKFVAPHGDRPVFNNFIEMPDTSFNEIRFGFYDAVSEFYYKLQEARNGTVTYSYYDGSGYTPCSESRFLECCDSVPSVSILCYKIKNLYFKNLKAPTFVAPQPTHTI